MKACLVFIKYISDKYANRDDFAPPVAIPPGASFKDMIALKGKSDIGDKINTQIIQPLIDANARLARSDFQWRDAHPEQKGNMRDEADVTQLLVLANLESLNAEFIHMGLAQAERLQKLNQNAIRQLQSLTAHLATRPLGLGLDKVALNEV